MGIYLNPGNKNYRELLSSPVVVDKSLLLQKTSLAMNTDGKYLCISRPRRFGKSTDASMLAAYYSKGCDSGALFEKLKIFGWKDYKKHLNRHNVIYLNMQDFLSASENIREMLEMISAEVIGELERAYEIHAARNVLAFFLNKIFAEKEESFIFIIDEWDCIFREFRNDKEAQKKYLDYLRLLFKDQPYVDLVYMTGILPIKKYGNHSALNMFDEISMLDAMDYSAYMGFTESEVEALCKKYGVSYEKMKDWYDGYRMKDGISTYSPRSVTAAVKNRDFTNYWSQTETYEALRVYIDLNLEGLKEDIIRMLAGEKINVNIRTFQNSMDSFETKDDVLTLLVHLGYLGYDSALRQVYIPNNEVKDTFIDSVERSDWSYAAEVFRNSRALLEATWNGQEKQVAELIQKSHFETSILQYNDENALSYTVNLAYIAAKQYYTTVRELPAGKGFADIAFLPKTDKPAMLVELKYDKTAETGIYQIKEKKYYLGLEKYLDNLLLVAVNYDKETKEHTCRIEKFRRSM